MRCVDHTIRSITANESLPTPRPCENEELSELFNELVLKKCLPLQRKTKSYMFLIDDNMYYHSMRYPYYQMARKCEYHYYVLNPIQEQ